VDETTRREAAGHVEWEPSAGPGFLGLPTVNYRPWTARTPQEEAARDRLGEIVHRCMAEGEWIPCTWERDRSKAAYGLQGAGWVCRRVRSDDPQP